MKYILYLFIVLITTNCYSQKAEANDKAIAFLNSLNTQQKEKALLEFDDDLRTQWHFLPARSYQREGIPLKELNATQKGLLHKLLLTYLSKKGYEKAITSIEFEGVLGELTNDLVYRDNQKYYVTFYGKPSSENIWGWSFEGHHLSLNFTVDNNTISYVPQFYGANPAIIPSGPHKGRRALVNEEDMALQLINMLDAKQKEQAIFRSTTFNGNISSNDSEITPYSPVGINASSLNEQQQNILLGLIGEYISSMPTELAESRMKKILSEEINDIYFAWAGGTELGKPHYYRIQGKTFLIELDNTQNDANHIHSVWREFDGDFGRNLIKEHYETSHQH